MHAARKAFIEAEASEKLRRTIKVKTRVSTGMIYQSGDIVYYKRNDSNQCKGPGRVLGRENKQILVKQVGVYIRVHGCRLLDAQNSQMTSWKKISNVKVVVMLRTKMKLLIYMMIVI